MDRAATFAQLGAPERLAVTSEEQTAGRGRDGRVWTTARGQALHTTLLLRPEISPERLSPLGLIMGVAVASAIEAMTGAATRLKWPNDVWLGDDPVRQKVAGILVTSRLSASGVDHVLVGIGVNVSTPLADLPDGATSIRAATGRNVTPAELLSEVLVAVDAEYAAYLAAAGRPALEGWRRRAALIGENVAVEERGQRITGVFRDVDADGALLLAVGNNEIRRIVAGDLVRGPRRTVSGPASGSGA
jgi:BirA family biotin operon repressor/biotin-[acetyl-CoA-carboxylase] ligase